MARIQGVDLPRNKRIEIALTYIFGIGLKTSQGILTKTGISHSQFSNYRMTKWPVCAKKLTNIKLKAIFAVKFN